MNASVSSKIAEFNLSVGTGLLPDLRSAVIGHWGQAGVRLRSGPGPLRVCSLVKKDCACDEF